MDEEEASRLRYEDQGEDKGKDQGKEEEEENENQEVGSQVGQILQGEEKNTTQSEPEEDSTCLQEDELADEIESRKQVENMQKDENENEVETSASNVKPVEAYALASDTFPVSSKPTNAAVINATSSSFLDDGYIPKPLTAEEKIIKNPTNNSKSNQSAKLKRILRELKEYRDAEEAENEPLTSESCLRPKLLSGEPMMQHPIHAMHYGIMEEKVQDSLYQFDSNFHKFCARR